MYCNYVGKLAEIHGKMYFSIQILLGYCVCAKDVSPTKSKDFTHRCEIVYEYGSNPAEIPGF
jgi:hypothetical protein